jgi:acetylornithine/succinyldiaminopimelate/putrescine aminotransferase
MESKRSVFASVALSLEDLAGAGYVEAVCGARAALTGEDIAGLRALARERVEFFPEAFQQRLLGLLPKAGQPCCAALSPSAPGAGTAAFSAHSKTAAAPLSGLGWYRVGEDGRLAVISKSEHYHTPLGHGFPGYGLIDRARRLGIPNATHNNTRGYLTRLLEQELVRTAAGPSGALNRVLNLETGSLAAEAAMKLILNRFCPVQADAPAARYAGRTPVLVVMADAQGGLSGNYHGTTIAAQILRGMWPGLLTALEKQGALLVRCVRPNRIDDLEAVFAEFEREPFKIAGFFHELVMMNYGAVRLTEEFVRRAYALCEQHDVPAVADEIQTGLWSPELFMHREYGVRPACVALGKGFPGGEYPASRLLFDAALDTLPQFGALVTNGQEELASLAYLVTMRWAEANAGITRGIGDYYFGRLEELAGQHPERIAGIAGRRHLAGICFHETASAQAFAARMNAFGFDLSVQTYKSDAPPVALTKLPLIAGYEMIDLMVERMGQCLAGQD